MSFSRQRKFHDELYAADRYQIYRCLKLGLNQQEIAHQLKRHPSTISREIKRNTGLRGYRAKQGHIRIISTIA
ncbi:MAG: helix-turn-helix domain-containing protein [Pseudomonadota bacterium]